MKANVETSFTAGALLVAFVVLKLVGVIDWSWWWVLAPVWIPFLIMILIVFFMLVCAIALNWNDFFGNPKKRK